MAYILQAHEPPRCKKGLPEFPKFLIRVPRLPGKRGRALWLCKCGEKFEAYIQNVTRLHTTSCGCEQARSRTMAFPTHGHAGGKTPRSPTYKSWQAMIARCGNPKHPAYARYGGRGIAVCEEWVSDFQTFLAYVGERPDGMTLDRIKGDEDYKPGNVRWATPAVQGKNRYNIIRVNIDGSEKLLVDVYRESNSKLSYAQVQNRVRLGWEVMRALTEPIKVR